MFVVEKREKMDVRRQEELETEQEDPKVSAKTAGLRYVTDHQPGLYRRRTGEDLTILDSGGVRVTDERILERVRSLVIPPAWEEVWICSFANGHLQATGRDARNRKQYRYHPRWRQMRDEVKFERMVAFGKVLPQIREQVEKDLGRRKLDHRRVLAAVVRLLEVSLIRIGNEKYWHDNQSFGLTTLRDRHVDIHGSKAEFDFKGKSGKQHHVTLSDRQLVRTIERCRDIPGYRLFQYLDEEGDRRTLDSGEVNDYIREVSGADFTAKDFRTWAGTVLAATALQEVGAVDSAVQAKRNVVRAVEDVAARLGNTPTICRKCYIHPAVIEAYLDGDLAEMVEKRVQREMQKDFPKLPPEEAVVLGFLQKRLGEK